MLSPDFLFPRFLVFPPANPSNFSHCKCFSIRIGIDLEAKLIEAVMDIESHANSTKCSQKNDHETLKVLEHYYEQKKVRKDNTAWENFSEKIDHM